MRITLGELRSLIREVDQDDDWWEITLTPDEMLEQARAAFGRAVPWVGQWVGTGLHGEANVYVGKHGTVVKIARMRPSEVRCTDRTLTRLEDEGSPPWLVDVVDHGTVTVDGVSWVWYRTDTLHELTPAETKALRAAFNGRPGDGSAESREAERFVRSARADRHVHHNDLDERNVMRDADGRFMAIDLDDVSFR